MMFEKFDKIRRSARLEPIIVNFIINEGVKQAERIIDAGLIFFTKMIAVIVLAKRGVCLVNSHLLGGS